MKVRRKEIIMADRARNWRVPDRIGRLPAAGRLFRPVVFLTDFFLAKLVPGFSPAPFRKNPLSTNDQPENLILLLHNYYK
jgi:hypothetical protein